MKRTLSVILCLLTFLTAEAQTPRYLVNNSKVENENYYYAFKAGSKQQYMYMGGLKWTNGFAIGMTGALITPEDIGSVVFKLNGEYEKLTFFMGSADKDDSSIGLYTLNINAGVPGTLAVSIYADGKKVFDHLVKDYAVGERFTIPINGAKELKFKLFSPNKDLLKVGFAEAALWKKGETPYESGNLIKGKPTKKQLVKDIWPYAVSNGHSLATAQTDVEAYKTVKSIKMGNNSYPYGIFFDMVEPLFGNKPNNTFFNLRGEYETLSFIAGPVNSEYAKNSGRGWITIKGDDKILYEYEVRQSELPKQFSIDVTGVHQLCFLSEQATESMNGCVVDAWVYPKGEAPAQLAQSDTEGTSMEVAVADPKLKALPDVCKLISNLPPYTTRSSVSHQVYDGSSDYVTFSMGGIKYSEGVILYKEPNFFDDDPTSYAVWDLGGEFDYLTFVVGFVGKSWAMTNDTIKIFADDRLLLTVPTWATMMNTQVIVPLGKCRKLRIENAGGTKMENGAYGIADLIVYRGEPVENDLFYHPKPNFPHNIDLIDLGKPYVHFVSGYENSQDQIFHDGTSKRSYVTTYDGTRIYKCFVLKTSVHFSLDAGILANKGAEGAASVAAGAAVMGATFFPIGAVGGTMVGTTMAAMGGLFLLAAGGTAYENSCAAFNTYGEYNSLTFTVACLRTQGDTQLLGPDYGQDEENQDYKETLLIGNNQEVVAELTVYQGMEPQTITVPIENCHQLMFWLANTSNSSAAFVFYDLKLSKDKCTLDIPDAAKLSKSHITETPWTATAPGAWERPSSSGARELDSYLSEFSNTHYAIVKAVENFAPEYDIVTYYLKTNSNEIIKAVKLRRKGVTNRIEAGAGSHHVRFVSALRDLERQIEDLENLQRSLTSLTISQANATLDLPSLGFGAVSYGKIVKLSNSLLKPMKTAVSTMLKENRDLYKYLRAVTDNAIPSIDGNSSKEEVVLCPLFKGEEVPNEDLMLVENFNLW